jgi:hypothetical protein
MATRHAHWHFDYDAVRTLPMMFFTPLKQPPIITGVPIPYPNTGRAHSSGQVLFFDEADAIFGKRTAVWSGWRL